MLPTSKFSADVISYLPSSSTRVLNVKRRGNTSGGDLRSCFLQTLPSDGTAVCLLFM